MERLTPESIIKLKSIKNTTNKNFNTKKLNFDKSFLKVIYLIVSSIIMLFCYLYNSNATILVSILSIIFLISFKSITECFLQLLKKEFSLGVGLYLFSVITYFIILKNLVNGVFFLSDTIIYVAILFCSAAIFEELNGKILDFYIKWFKNSIFKFNNKVKNAETGLIMTVDQVKKGDILLCDVNESIMFDGICVKGEVSIERYFKDYKNNFSSVNLSSCIEKENGYKDCSQFETDVSNCDEILTNESSRNLKNKVFLGDKPINGLTSYKVESFYENSLFSKKIEYLKKFTIEEKKSFNSLFNILNINIFMLAIMIIIIGLATGFKEQIIVRLTCFLLSSITFSELILIFIFRQYFLNAKNGVIFRKSNSVSLRIFKSKKLITELETIGIFYLNDFKDNNKFFNNIKMLHGLNLACSLQNSSLLRSLGEAVKSYLIQNNIYDESYFQESTEKLSQNKKFLQILETFYGGLKFNFDGVIYEIGTLKYFKQKNYQSYEYLKTFYDENMYHKYELCVFVGGCFMGMLSFDFEVDLNIVKSLRNLYYNNLKPIVFTGFEKETVYPNLKEFCDKIEIYSGADLSDIQNYKEKIIKEKNEFLQLKKRFSSSFVLFSYESKKDNLKDKFKDNFKDKAVKKTFLADFKNLTVGLNAVLSIKKSIKKIYLNALLIFLINILLAFIFFNISTNLVGSIALILFFMINCSLLVIASKCNFFNKINCN